MSNDIPFTTKVYYATFIFLLTYLVLVLMAVVFNQMNTVRGIEDLKLILLNDYEITQ